MRPGTDIYLTGHAYTPRGRRKIATMVEVRVGPCRKRVAVIGDRYWTRNGSGERFSAAEPFESMPLLYERAFGGTAEPSKGRPAQWEPRNPVGRGFYASKAEAIDKPLPNLEDPDDLVTTFRSRPAPCGLGPVARNWQPRLAHAGTYDEAWVSERAPLWPVDFDERFFCAASPGLTSAKHLSGGELALLSGVSPDGDYALTLPRVRLQAKARFRQREERRLMVLDAIHFEPDRGDRGSFTMIWRTSFGVVRDLLEHESTLVRELDPWEDAPP